MTKIDEIMIGNLPITLKENQNEKAAIHALELNQSYLRNKYVLACKMPDILSNLFINYSDENKIPFAPSGLRSILLYFYPEILGVYFDWDVIRNNRYWLYLPADISPAERIDLIEGIIQLTEDWINGFPNFINNKISLPNNCIAYEQKLLVDLCTTDIDRIIIPLMGNEIMNKHYNWLNDHNPEIHYKRNKKNASIILPIAWLPDHDESNFSLLSNPIVIKRGKRKFTMQYRLRMLIDNSHCQKRVNFYFEKTRIISDTLVDSEGNYSFHPNGSGNTKTKNRTTYLIVQTRHRRKLIRVPIKKDGDRPAILFRKMAESYLRLNTNINFPNYEDVFKSPSIFHGEEVQYNDKISFLNEGVFIPYQLEDMGSTHRLKSGLSLNEHKHLFDHISSLLPYKRVEARTRPISLENSSIEGGSTKLDYSQIYENKKIVVVVATDEEELISPIIREAIEDMTKMAIVNETGEIKKMKGKFNDKKSSVNRYFVKEVNCETDGSINYFFKDLEFQDVGSFHLTIKFTKQLTPFVKKLDKTEGYFSSTLDRIEEIKNLSLNYNDETYLIIDMPKYKYPSVDPKAAVKFGLLEKGILSHNIDLDYLKNIRNKIKRLEDEFTQIPSQKLEDQIKKGNSNFLKVRNELKQKLRMTLYKIFEKEGFTNQMVHVTKNTTLQLYFADMFQLRNKENQIQYVYSLAKYIDGKVYFKFTNQTQWYDYGDALKSLTLLSQKANVIDSSEKFTAFLKANVEHGSILFLDYAQKETYDKLYFEYEDQKLGFELGYLTQSKYKVPYICRERDEEAMFGSFLTTDEDYYISMPPKPFTHQIIVHLNSQLENEAYLNRTSLKIKTTYTNWAIIEVVHRLRNISLTYASYLKVPYPLHILQNTFARIFELNPLYSVRR